MNKNFKIVKVDYQYCDYLRNFDYRVSYNAGMKELRPYIGVLFTINQCEYFAPLSSPKRKHVVMKDTLDLIKINGGKQGVINFNNMIPVTENNYDLLNLNAIPQNEKERKRQFLLLSQLRWLNRHSDLVRGKVHKLYLLYKKDKLPQRVKNRCCNFPLLEDKCMIYNGKRSD